MILYITWYLIVRWETFFFDMGKHLEELWAHWEDELVRLQKKLRDNLTCVCDELNVCFWSDIFIRYFYLIFVVSSNASIYLEECPPCWEHHVGEEGTEKIITINTDWKREVIYLKIHKRDQNLWQSFSADEKNVSWWSFQRRQKFSGIAILFFKLFFLLIWLCCLTYISFSVHFCPAPP